MKNAEWTPAMVESAARKIRKIETKTSLSAVLISSAAGIIISVAFYSLIKILASGIFNGRGTGRAQACKSFHFLFAAEFHGTGYRENWSHLFRHCDMHGNAQDDKEGNIRISKP